MKKYLILILVSMFILGGIFSHPTQARRVKEDHINDLLGLDLF